MLSPMFEHVYIMHIAVHATHQHLRINDLLRWLTHLYLNWLMLHCVCCVATTQIDVDLHRIQPRRGCVLAVDPATHTLQIPLSCTQHLTSAREVKRNWGELKSRERLLREKDVLTRRRAYRK